MTDNRYLFRGFHKDENGAETIYLNRKQIKGNWEYGNLVYIRCENKYYIVSYDVNIYDENKFGDIKEIDIIEVIPETVSQYTGLKDKNGKKIFENDIVKARYEENNGYIKWNSNNASFQIKGIPSHTLKRADELEVIGNIFDEEVK